MWPIPQFPADLVTFTEETLNEDFIFCAGFFMLLRKNLDPQRHRFQGVVIFCKVICRSFTPFHATDVILHPWRDQKNSDFLLFSRVVERGEWHKMC